MPPDFVLKGPDPAGRLRRSARRKDTDPNAMRAERHRRGISPVVRDIAVIDIDDGVAFLLGFEAACRKFASGPTTEPARGNRYVGRTVAGASRPGM